MSAVHRRERVMLHMLHGKFSFVDGKNATNRLIRITFLLPTNQAKLKQPNPQYSRILFPLFLYLSNDEHHENISAEFRSFLASDTSTITRRKKSSATFMPCCMPPRIARSMPSSCASIFRAFLSQIGGQLRSTFRARLGLGAGAPVARVAETRPRGVSRQRRSSGREPFAMRPRNRPSGSTRPSVSSRCRRLFGSSTSAAIRCSTNT